MASTDQHWKPRARDYELERRRLAPALLDCPPDEHPLRELVSVVETITTSDAKKKKKDESKQQSAVSDPLSGGSDPLSMAAGDPLSAAVSDPLSAVLMSSTKSVPGSSFGAPAAKPAKETADITFEPWSSKRTTILASYTTSEKIPITTSFLSHEERERLETKAQAAVMADKVKHRLEQLDDLEEGSVQETLNLSQRDYVKKIDDMNHHLSSAWNRDQRVHALKVAIQCSKLLADNSVLPFYPSKFVLVTDILDNFGELVYQRIRQKSTYIPGGSMKPVPLPEGFTPDQVPDSAKETCRNWFFKIASIRELIPRFYVEAAILKCYSFLTDTEFSQALIRLTKMARGIGDPLVSAYARSYLCRVGHYVAPSARGHLMLNYTDYLLTFTQLNSDAVQNMLAVQSQDMSRYMHLYSPAVEWILQCVAHRSPEAVLEEVMDLTKSHTSNAVVLHAIISCFAPELISKRAMLFTELIRDCEETAMPKYKLYVSLGNCVVLSNPPQKDHLPLLNNVWKAVMKLKKPSEYIACAHVWIEFVAKNFSKKEVNTLLDDVIKHMTPDRAFESHYPELMAVVNFILPHYNNFIILFSMDKFLPFVDLFQKEEVKVEVCTHIIRAFTLQQVEETCDPLIINAMMYLCKAIHDSLNALSLADDRRQTGELICSFLRKINFGKDFEQQLSFFVEARSNFSNIDAVLIHLVHSVNWLAMRTRAVVKGRHTRKTGAFVRACVAYSFITIPSVENSLHRLHLLLVSGRVAIANGALSQGDTFFKSAINGLKDVPPYMDIDRKRQCTEPLVSNFLSNLFSTLLVVPDNPDKDVLFLVKGVLNGMEEYQWQEGSDAKYRVYMQALCMLSGMCQCLEEVHQNFIEGKPECASSLNYDEFLYSVDGVDSNDMLYAGDRKFTAVVSQLAHKLLELISERIKSLSTTSDDQKRQGKLALGLFTRMVCHSDLSDPGVANMVGNLWNLAQKHSTFDSPTLSRYRSLLVGRSDHCQDLIGRLSTLVL